MSHFLLYILAILNATVGASFIIDNRYPLAVLYFTYAIGQFVMVYI